MTPSLLVTGAAGFVGLNVVADALDRGRPVVGLSSAAIDPATAASLARRPGRFVEVVGDVRDTALLDRLITTHRVDRVVHLAAITASTARERRAADTVVSVNLAGLAAALTAAANGGVRRFVSVGSIAVFGGEPADGSVIDEDTPHAPKTLYALTKSAGEAITAHLGALHGLDWVVARLGRLYGPFEHDTGVRDTLSQIYQVTAWATAGRAVRFERPCRKNWSYAPDVAVRLALLADAPAHRHAVYHLGTEPAWTLADWCARLATRFPSFRYTVGDATDDGAIPIDLGGARDGGLLSWRRFDDEFRPPPPTGLDAAFDATLRSLADSSLGPAR